MTIQAIEELTVGILNRMSAADLYKTALEIKKVAKRRARSIEVHNLENISPAYKRMIQNGGYEFKKSDYQKDTGTLSVNKLRGYIARMKQYITSDTSTYKGYKEWINSTAERFSDTQEDWYRNASEQARVEFWHIYSDFLKDRDYSTWLVAFHGSDRIQDIVMEEYAEWNIEEETYVSFYERVRERLNREARNATRFE